MELRGFRHFGLARASLIVNFWLLALTGITILRLLLAAVIPLSPDETYYFTWTAHLQAGYYDHPPMVALLIRAGTDICGPTALGVRLFGPLLAALGSVFLWHAGEDFFPGRDAGVIAAALFNSTIILGVGSIVMTPDTPLVFFWTAALAALGRLSATRAISDQIESKFQSDRIKLLAKTNLERFRLIGKRSSDERWWLVVGVAAGLALLSKYTAVLLVAGIGLWLLTRHEGRMALKKPWPWLGFLLVILIFSPNIAWNAAHGWVSYFKQGGRITQFDPSRSVGFLTELVFGQIALVTPIIFALSVFGLWQLRGAKNATASLLWWLTLLPGAVMLEHVVSNRVQANWPAIVLPAAFLAAAALPEPQLKKWLRPALGLGFGLTLLVYAQALAAFFPIPAKQDPVALQLTGWQDMVAKVSATNPLFITSDEYTTIAELAYYVPRRIPVIGFGVRWGYFGMQPAAALQGKTGILVTRRQDAFCPQVLGTVTRKRGRDVIVTYRLCRMIWLPDMVLLPRP